MTPRRLLLLISALVVMCHVSAQERGETQYIGGRKKRRRFGMDGFISHNPDAVAGSEEARIKDDLTLVQADEIVEQPMNARKPSMVKIPGREGHLMLPDRESVLSFKNFEDFETSEEKQAEQRDSAWWGRLYVEGYPQSLQYFRGHFGSPPPLNEVTLLLADPLIMCNMKTFDVEFSNSDAVKGIDGPVFVVAKRGNCTFGEKALAAEAAGAKGILYLNDRPGNEHPAAPDVREMEDFAPSMLSDTESAYLLKGISSAKSSNAIQARFIPIACVNSPTDKTRSFCEAVTSEERDFESNVKYGGYVDMKSSAGDPLSFPYLLATYGTPISQTASTSYNLVSYSASGTESGCSAITNEESIASITGKAVLVPRGGCSFYNKTSILAKAGAAAVVIANEDEILSRPGMQPRWMGLEVDIPTILVGRESASAIMAEIDQADGELTIEARPDSAVNANFWQTLQRLETPGEDGSGGWPKRTSKKLPMYEKLLKEFVEGNADSAIIDALKKSAVKGGVKIDEGDSGEL